MSSELEWPAKRVRETYLTFFKERGHANVDPDLIFTTAAGMNKYKPNLWGMADPRTEPKRACNTEKYIRVSESYGEGETVGSDNYPHTSFEMLRNWSIGDYFKEEAITWAWELLTKVYGLQASHIYATYFGGDEKSGLQPDNEARDIWLKFLPSGRVLPFGCKDNYWKMGDTGPCGPCTRIHYDCDAAFLVQKEHSTCIEIWNLVFIQSHREIDGSLTPLPTKHVDTSMGFERLTSILQHRLISYDTDIFFPIYDDIQKATGAAKYDGKRSYVSEAYRVVADHIITLSFAIAHGSLPGKESHEHAPRRVFQRAVRYGMEYLEAKPGFLSGLVNSVVRVMGDVFTELKEHEENITEILRIEEAGFCNIMQLVLDLTDIDRRDNALLELTTKYALFPDLAPILWYSKDTFTILIAELVSYSPCCITADQSKRLSKLLRLIKCMASHSDTRTYFLKASLHSFLYPFIRARATNLPTRIVQKNCLGVLVSLVNVDDPKDIQHLLGSEGLLPVCLHSLTQGSTQGSKDTTERSLCIIRSILLNKVGFEYVTSEAELYMGVAKGIAELVDSSMEHGRDACVKISIECYLLLSTSPRVCRALTRCFPRSLRDKTVASRIPMDSGLALENLLQAVFTRDQQ